MRDELSYDIGYSVFQKIFSNPYFIAGAFMVLLVFALVVIAVWSYLTTPEPVDFGAIDGDKVTVLGVGNFRINEVPFFEAWLVKP